MEPIIYTRFDTEESMTTKRKLAHPIADYRAYSLSAEVMFDLCAIQPPFMAMAAEVPHCV